MTVITCVQMMDDEQKKPQTCLFLELGCQKIMHSMHALKDTYSASQLCFQNG